MGIKFVKEFVANEEGETVVTITEEDKVDSNLLKELNRAMNKL